MLIILILTILALVSYFKPTFAVGLILALLPTYLIRYSFQNIPTTFLELMVLVFVIVTILKNIRSILDLKNLGYINWFILAFLIAGIISVFVSPDKHAAIGQLKAFIIEPILLFYALRLSIKNNSDLTTPLNLLFLGAITVSVLGILQYYTFIELPLRFWGSGSEVERITSVFQYPNALALYLAPLITFFLAAFMFDEKILNRKNLIVGLVVMIFALILTFSRGAWIAVSATTLILLFLKYPWKKVLVASILLLAVGLTLPATRNRLLLITKDPSSNAHLDLMNAGFEKIQQSPILGNGLGGFPNTLANMHFLGEILNYPHNIFINFWVEMGLLGLISFFGIMYTAVIRQKNNRNWYTIASLAFLLTMIIHGIVDVPYFKNDLSILFWFIISIFYTE
jgi:O-antigen ligase